ncbi:VirE protein [Lentimicrobium sp. L6]|uniref:BT4734/BF3469 family protein n=1 Tax=Lentimicrobium sp. L6 TaxID=2735916 RepID=UPI001552524B|nr:BT4734/BF3469 family protein [Lentimicrobium sp. L6]NPD86438.1 VirE protein [Lentimicrobium sp. L6]
MEISRKAILYKTHYGLNIYSHVLRHYYPDETVLSLSGRVCKPAKNPFNENKFSLMVSVVDNCARHTDTENSIPDGDVFDFAKLHFKKEGQELHEMINNELHLHIGEERNFYGHKSIPETTEETQEVQKPRIRIPQCSYFKHPVSNIIPSKTINLTEVFNFIRGDSFAACTSTLRNIEDVKEARKYKAYNFDYVTFSGTFSKRNDKALLSHSGLLTIDIDHISNIDSLKDSLLQDQYFETELLFISPSGDGLKWIIPIDISKAKHQDFFKAVSNYIRQTYQLEVDQSGKDISRACFIPHDAAVYINPKYLQ